MPEEKKSEETLAQKIKQLKEQYGKIIIVDTDMGTFLFRKPNRIAVKKFFDTIQRSTYDASYGLCVDTVVSPSPEELMRMEESNPGIIIILSAEIQDFFSKLSRVNSREA